MKEKIRQVRDTEGERGRERARGRRVTVMGVCNVVEAPC